MTSEEFGNVLETIDKLKHNLTDQEYIDTMTSLSKIWNSTILNTTRTIEDNDEYFELHQEYELQQIRINKLQRKLDIVYNVKPIINNYLQSKNITNSFDKFLNSPFNLLNHPNYLENFRSCKCINMHFCKETIDDFITCGNLQNVILHLPLLALLLYPSSQINQMMIIETIQEYNMITNWTNINFDSVYNDDYFKIFNKIVSKLLNFIENANIIKYKTIICFQMFQYLLNNGNCINHSHYKFNLVKNLFGKIKEFINDKTSEREFQELFALLKLPSDTLNIIAENLSGYFDTLETPT